MALIAVGSLLLGCLWIAQGFYILRTGDARPFFLQTSDRPSTRTDARKSRLAVAYLIPGFGVLGILASALVRANKDQVLQWVTAHLQDLGFALVLIVGGFIFVWRPGIMLKSAKSAHPDLDVTQPSVVFIARLIGFGFMAMGLFVLGMIRTTAT